MGRRPQAGAARRLLDFHPRRPLHRLVLLHGLFRHTVLPAPRRINQEMLWGVEKQKEHLAQQILRTGAPLSKEAKLLLTIKGVTFLTALAFLADVGDARRFKTLRKMNAYLGLEPRLRESGQRSHTGDINRASRSLTRTLLTQSVNKALFGSATLRRFCERVYERSGTGRARIAVIRKRCGIMRQMILIGEGF